MSRGAGDIRPYSDPQPAVFRECRRTKRMPCAPRARRAWRPATLRRAGVPFAGVRIFCAHLMPARSSCPRRRVSLRSR